jgi:hypothetical protein
LKKKRAPKLLAAQENILKLLEKKGNTTENKNIKEIEVDLENEVSDYE